MQGHHKPHHSEPIDNGRDNWDQGTRTPVKLQPYPFLVQAIGGVGLVTGVIQFLQMLIAYLQGTPSVTTRSLAWCF
jgi:hypothetical protein